MCNKCPTYGHSIIVNYCYWPLKVYVDLDMVLPYICYHIYTPVNMRILPLHTLNTMSY